MTIRKTPEPKTHLSVTYVHIHLTALSGLCVRRTEVVVRIALCITEEPNTLLCGFRESRYLDKKDGVDMCWKWPSLESMKEMSTIL